MIDENKLVDRFLQYVSFDTQSDEEQDALLPSTPEQMVFARALAEELKGLGLSDVSLDDHGYVMATLPASAGIRTGDGLHFPYGYQSGRLRGGCKTPAGPEL